MLRLSSLTVSNFRSLQSFSVTFPELAILVGKNDIGKSNILAAIRVLLEGESVAPSDFYDLSKPINIEVTFEDAATYLPLCDPKSRPKIEDRINSKGQIIIRRVTDEDQKVGKVEILNEKDGTFGTPTGIDAALKPFLPEVIFIGTLDDVSEEAESNKRGRVPRAPGLRLGLLSAPPLLNSPHYPQPNRVSEEDTSPERAQRVNGTLFFKPLSTNDLGT